jgi:hypothetical protein
VPPLLLLLLLVVIVIEPPSPPIPVVVDVADALDEVPPSPPVPEAPAASALLSMTVLPQSIAPPAAIAAPIASITARRSPYLGSGAAGCGGGSAAPQNGHTSSSRTWRSQLGHGVRGFIANLRDEGPSNIPPRP